MKTIIVCIEWPGDSEVIEFQVGDDATEEEIEELAKDEFFNRCNYGVSIKEPTHA